MIKYFIDIWCDLRLDDDGRDYGDSRPYKRTLDDREGRGEVSQIPSNNSSHTTKKKGRKNTKFNTHENTFSPVSGPDMIPSRAIPQLMSNIPSSGAPDNTRISRRSIILHWRHLVPQDGGAAEEHGAGPGPGHREALGPERGRGSGQGARRGGEEVGVQEKIPRRLPPGRSL